MARKRTKITPEVRAQWAREQREDYEVFERYFARVREYRAWQARRRARLRRLTFGLLGRDDRAA
jgi:putative component of toxin-antitoxin plasmid stabilization module